MNNVYFISSKYHGCNYVRMLLPMFHNGWNGSVVRVGQAEKPMKYIMQEISASNIIVFHRPNSVEHHKLGKLLKDMGKKIVFDNDDTFKKPGDHPFHVLDVNGFEDKKKFSNNLINNFILNSDLVTCSTDYLAEEYKLINPNVAVLPNCVDPFDWAEPLRNDGDKVRIGLVGSTVYNHDFKHIKDVITKLSERKDVQLVLFGLQGEDKRKENRLIERIYHKEFEFWDMIPNLEHVEWCKMEDYFDMLNNLKLDIMLIPRAEEDFNRAKSNIKFLEAAMCEIPCIAQGFTTNDSPYDKDIDGANGILIKDNSKWLDETVRLIEDKELRRKMGKTAKEYVLNYYNIENRAHLWADAYNKLTQ